MAGRGEAGHREAQESRRQDESRRNTMELEREVFECIRLQAAPQPKTAGQSRAGQGRAGQGKGRTGQGSRPWIN